MTTHLTDVEIDRWSRLAKNSAGTFLSAFSRALDELLELRKEREWMLIESAPKDGTPILIFVPGSRKLVFEASWAFQYEGAPGEWYTPEGFSGRGVAFLPESPTHWLPLPLPPTPAQEVDHG